MKKIVSSLILLFSVNLAFASISFAECHLGSDGIIIVAMFAHSIPMELGAVMMMIVISQIQDQLNVI